jgi:hypothetical protein
MWMWHTCGRPTTRNFTRCGVCVRGGGGGAGGARRVAWRCCVRPAYLRAPERDPAIGARVTTPTEVPAHAHAYVQCSARGPYNGVVRGRSSERRTELGQPPGKSPPSSRGL